MKKFLLAVCFLLGPVLAYAEGKFTLGARYEGWNSNYLSPFEGSEFWFPASLTLGLGGGVQAFVSGQFCSASYTDSFGGVTTSQDLSGFSDTLLGAEFRFEGLSLPSVLHVAFNLPSGDTTWEGKQSAANIPTEFVGSRYQGSGFGVNAYYGMAFPTGDASELGVAAGYQFTGGYNPIEDLADNDLNMGDSIFLALNHFQAFEEGRTQVFRLNMFYSFPENQNGVDIYQLGPSVNASYSWDDPTAFSIEVGGNYFLPSMSLSGGSLETEEEPFYGPRIYANPSYAFGDLVVVVPLKYVFPNGYDEDDPLHTGGGFLVGLEPSYRAALDETSALRFTGSLESITVNDAGLDEGGDLASANYIRWTIGTSYEVNL